MSLRLKLANLALRLFERPHLARVATPQEARTGFERKARFWFRAPRGSRFESTQIAVSRGEIPALRVAGPGAGDQGLILYFHGGGYFFGSPRTHQAMLARLSALTGCVAILPDYRLAPEHAFPAAPEDALTVYQTLLDQGQDPQRIILGGDSAGGGLVLSLLGQICALGLPQPRMTIALSPWADLTCSAASFVGNNKSEVVLPTERMPEVRDYYLQGAAPIDLRASPVFANFAGASPVLITASSSEILLDDARSVARVLDEQGVSVKLTVHEGLPHVWQIFGGLLPEADRSLEMIAGEIRAALAPANAAPAPANAAPK